MWKLSPKILFSCVTLAILSHQSAVNGATLKCEYHQSKFMLDGVDVYYCDVKDNGIFTDARVNIDSVEGKHDIGIYNSNVNGLYINRIYSVKFLPRNLENIFGDLVMIHILDTNLQEITQDDLKVFPKLINFYLRGNKITTIDANLFEFNPELREIYLFRNQISHIDPNVFNHLNHLTTLYLRQNQCRKFIYDARDSRSQVLELIQQVRRGDCTNTEVMEKQKKAQQQGVNKVYSAADGSVDGVAFSSGGCSLSVFYGKIIMFFALQYVIKNILM